jgi:uncharacterized protein YegL
LGQGQVALDLNKNSKKKRLACCRIGDSNSGSQMRKQRNQPVAPVEDLDNEESHALFKPISQDLKAD